MRTKTTLLATVLLAGCSSISQNQASPWRPPAQQDRPYAASPQPATPSMSMDRYKRTLAQHVAHVNPDKIYPGNPQALLRSVVVIKFVLDANGRLIRSDTLRSNGDSVTEATALTALRNSAPFPRPPANLLSQGRLELLETMLFNDDGRFQLRSIAAPQLDE